MNKIYFQGSFGAYSHIAALSIDSKAEIKPCKTFDECFLKASNEEDADQTFEPIISKKLQKGKVCNIRQN